MGHVASLPSLIHKCTRGALYFNESLTHKRLLLFLPLDADSTTYNTTLYIMRLIYKNAKNVLLLDRIKVATIRILLLFKQLKQ